MRKLRTTSLPVHSEARGAALAAARGDALAAARKLASDARDLRNGCGAFAGLTVEERSEQLAAMGLSPIAACKFPGFATLGDDALIAIVCAAEDGESLPLREGETRDDVLYAASAELARRLGHWEPSPAERAQIEHADELFV
jgi:hypothetical protein